MLEPLNFILKLPILELKKSFILNLIFLLFAVHDAAGIEENVADSGEESEDEWNYYKGDSAESEKVSSSKADQEVNFCTLNFNQIVIYKTCIVV